MTTHEILVEAYNILERRGWCQTTMSGEDGSVCLLGAIHGATGVKAISEAQMYTQIRGGEAFEAVRALGCSSSERRHGWEDALSDVWKWNDKQRSVEPVKERLLAAIERTSPAPDTDFLRVKELV